MLATTCRWLRKACYRRKYTIVVGMSGGVDSSVAAFILKNQGHDVIGMYMTNWDASDEQGVNVCSNAEDEKAAEQVCQQIGIPLIKENFTKDYWINVFEPFLQGYTMGETPNPDVWCNRKIKFGCFLERALSLGADRVATGHYARTSCDDIEAAPLGSSSPSDGRGRPRTRLWTGVDPRKDQSYFLSCVSQDALQKAMFPVGEMQKADVRAMAAANGLVSANRKDSYGICFIGKRNFKEFLAEYLETTAPGNFLHVDSNEVIGAHDGAVLFTPGQRARIPSYAHKMYVVRTDVASGDVVVAPKEHESHFTQRFTVRRDSVCWVSGRPPSPLVLRDEARALCRLRHGAALAPCLLSSGSGDTYTVTFDEPQRALARGQVAAFYDALNGQECLGGVPMQFAVE